MTEPKKSESVFDDWVLALPFKAQLALIGGLRPCDTDFSKSLPTVRALRYAVCKPLNDTGDPEQFFCTSLVPFNFEILGGMPSHWLRQMAMAIEVVAYLHPIESTRSTYFEWYYAYYFHMTHAVVEPMLHMLRRMETTFGPQDSVLQAMKARGMAT